MGNFLGGLGIFAAIGGFLVFAVIVLIIALVIGRSWIKVAKIGEALVVTSKAGKGSDPNATRPAHVVVNGRALVNPMLQSYERISLRSRTMDLAITAVSEDKVTLTVKARSLVKIGSSPDQVRRAAERFSTQDSAIESFISGQLEGVLRGIVAQQTVEALMRDRQKFSVEIAGVITEELERQGLELDSFQISDISDSDDYIASLGRPEIEAKRKAAEIAQTRADREIAQARISAEEANLIEQTALDENTANADARIGRAQAEAEQASALARATAEQQVLEQRAENRKSELEAEVNRVADADRYRREQEAEAEAFERQRRAEADAQVAEAEATAVRVKAEAEAESIRMLGEAKAEAIEAEANALGKNKEALLAQRALEQLPALMESFAKGYSNVGAITIVGGSGSAGDHLADENAVAMARVYEANKAATGIDIPAILQGQVAGRATGAGFKQGVEDAADSDAAAGGSTAQPAVEAGEALTQDVFDLAGEASGAVQDAAQKVKNLRGNLGGPTDK